MTGDPVRVALVTGAARGIGHAVAAALACSGAIVFAVDIQDAPASPDGRVTYLRADVSDPSIVEEVFQRIEAATSGVDLLVNNAGILRPEAVADVSRESWGATMRVNLEAPFFLAKRAAETMRRIGRGSIVNLASTSAFVSSPDQSVYETSKAGVAALTRALALEFAPHGVRVNAVAPGLIDTDLTRTLFGTPERLEARARRRIPLARAGLPEEIADAVLFLASPDADYITGQVLVVDGGWLLT